LRRLSVRIHPDVAKSLYNLAWIYSTRQDYTKAELFYTGARPSVYSGECLWSESFLRSHTTLNDLALLYLEKGDYDQCDIGSTSV